MTSAKSKNLFVHDFGRHVAYIFRIYNALDICVTEILE